MAEELRKGSGQPEQLSMPLKLRSGASDWQTSLQLEGVWKRCVAAWGAPAQVYQAAEEAVELAQALLHLNRAKKTKALNEVIEEIADVELCISQVKYMASIPASAINAVKLRKIRKLKKLLREHEHETR